MAIDRDEARTWSKDRIIQELADLRRRAYEYEREIDDHESEMDDLEEDARENRKRGDFYCDHEKQLDAMEDFKKTQYRIVGELEADIEFLKSLLDDIPKKLLRQAVTQRGYGFLQNTLRDCQVKKGKGRKYYPGKGEYK